jgi:PAT family beta-lactamase induction signal transducer AmpG
MVQETYIEPVIDFFSRYGKEAILILLLVGFYRVSDIVLGAIANVFYQDNGFNKQQIGSMSIVFGIIMTISGGFIGGVLTMRYGILKILLLGAVLSSLTNLLFLILANVGTNMFIFGIVIVADNLSGGLAIAAFIAYLSSLTNISFTAVQYAIFSSLMTLFPKLLGGYSGSVVDQMGYPAFFVGTTLLGVPVILLIIFIMHREKNNSINH